MIAQCVYFIMFPYRSEVHSIQNRSSLLATWEVVIINGRHLLMLATLLCLSFTVEHFQVSSLFMAIALFEKLRLCLLRFLLTGVRTTIELQVSIKRFKVKLQWIVSHCEELKTSLVKRVFAFQLAGLSHNPKSKISESVLRSSKPSRLL